MKKIDLVNYINKEAVIHPEYDVNEEKFTCFPFVDNDTNEARFATTYIVELVHNSEKKRHMTLLAYDGEEYFFWCGDSFIEKNRKYTMKKAKELVTEATKDLKGDIEEATKQMLDIYNAYDASTGCRFWASWKSKGEVCSHIKHLFALLNLNDSILSKLEDNYKEFTTKTRKANSSLMNKFERYAFKKHMLLDGPKGFGKTYEVYEFLDNQNIPTEDIFEVGGFEGLESIDLLGQNIPFVKEVKKANKSIVLKANNVFASQEGTEHVQDLVWMDGALTAAFRNASKGKKTVLMIDEILRIPQRELSILVAALTPNNKGEFTLRTRRIIGLDEDGCGIEEVIKIKKENLWVVATTNIGAEYNIDEIESAFADRFMIVHLGADREIVKTIVTKKIKERKFKVDAVAKIMEFFDKMTKHKTTENLSKIINTRHLSEIIEFALDKDDIPNVAIDQILKWVDRDTDGLPDETQIKLIEKTINSIWS